MIEITPKIIQLVESLFTQGTALPSSSRSDYNSDEDYEKAIRKLYDLAKISNMLQESEIKKDVKVAPQGIDNA
jgi:hypothetical protein